MQFQELIQGIAPIGVEGSPDREVSDIACDSRRGLPGRRFVALPGDSVLIAGSGQEAYQEPAGTVVPLGARARAKEVLEPLGWSRGRWQGR